MKLLLAFLFFSCAQLPVPVEKSPEVAVEVLRPIEVEAPKFRKVKVIIATLEDKTGKRAFSEKRAERFKLIASRVEEIINSEEFEKGVKEFTFNGKKSFVDTTHSNDKVFETITKNDWTLHYRLESLRSSTVGYTYPNVEWIAINSKKFDAMDDAEIAANIVHEYGGHKLGYAHAQKWSKPRDYSVPYGIGKLTQSLYQR